MSLVHATCVALDGIGVLIRGPSGAGKSDLAPRLIDGGALLVADDQVEITEVDGALRAAPPAAIAGLLEVRGVGLVRLAHLEKATVELVVDLVDGEEIDRLPEPETVELSGLRLPLLRLDALHASAPAKLRLVARGLALHSET